MSVINNPNWEAQKVKELGEQIGYGNMMALASALWRKMLIDSGGNASGAFVPALMDKNNKQLIKECKLYDSIVNSLDIDKTGCSFRVRGQSTNE